MELYLRWLTKYEQESGELPSLVILLCAGKKQEQIELLELERNGIYVAKYLTVLPPKELLQAKRRRSFLPAAVCNPQQMSHPEQICPFLNMTKTRANP